MFGRKSFGNKKIQASTAPVSYRGQVKSDINRSTLMRLFIVGICITGVLIVGSRVRRSLAVRVQQLSHSTTTVISQQLGSAPIRDDQGNFNMLVMGYGGEGHQGGYLTDSLIVASFDPEEGSVTFVSLPRDIWIQYRDENNILQYAGRINGLFAYDLTQILREQPEIEWDDAVALASVRIRAKTEQITGLSIPYYAIVSFDGFKDFVDEIGGLKIDVPERLIDNQFPDVNLKGFDPLIVEPGLQLMDGELALKYARSRKSTSDFSRAARQQLIIESVVESLGSTFSLTSLGNVKDVYDSYRNMVYTNITPSEILYMSQYKDNLQYFDSVVLHYECGTYFTQMRVGCFLITPPRDWFDGASVLLPEGASYSDFDTRDRIRSFVDIATHDAGYLHDDATLSILNGISREGAGAYQTAVSGKANEVANMLVQHGFEVADIDNAPTPLPRTQLYTAGTGNYDDTIDVLKMFMSVDVMSGSLLSGAGIGNIQLIIGDNFLESWSSPSHPFW